MLQRVLFNFGSREPALPSWRRPSYRQSLYREHCTGQGLLHLRQPLHLEHYTGECPLQLRITQAGTAVYELSSTPPGLASRALHKLQVLAYTVLMMSANSRKTIMH